MKRTLLLLAALGALGATGLWADDQTRDVQAELKNQGFYFGEVDGQPGASTSAAVRRFQIRNGLEVTGEVNTQVLQSLGIGAAAPAAPAQIAPPPVARTTPRGPVDLRRDETVKESDRRALMQEEMRSRDQNARPANPGGDVPANQPSERYRGVFAGSPYMSAPRVVQEETFLRAQRMLADRGLLRQVDGAPGPATEEAIVSYQRSSRIPVSGRLDLETLASLRLLPGRGAANPRMERPAANVPGSGRVAPPRSYRGVWVQ